MTSCTSSPGTLIKTVWCMSLWQSTRTFRLVRVNQLSIALNMTDPQHQMFSLSFQEKQSCSANKRTWEEKTTSTIFSRNHPVLCRIHRLRHSHGPGGLVSADVRRPALSVGGRPPVGPAGQLRAGMGGATSTALRLFPSQGIRESANVLCASRPSARGCTRSTRATLYFSSVSRFVRSQTCSSGKLSASLCPSKACSSPHLHSISKLMSCDY